MHAADTGTTTAPEMVMEHGSDTPSKDQVLIDSRFRLTQKTFALGKQTLAFQLLDAERRVIPEARFKIVHEKRVHLLFVRKDMTQFQHLHPTFADGRWTMDVTFLDPGEYFLYADIAPEGEEPLVLQETLVVEGKPAYAEPNPTKDGKVTVDGYVATLAAFNGSGGGPVTLDFVLTKNGKPVTSVGKYLGAYGHAVILKHFSPLTFVHTHPLDEAAPKDGHVSFMATFPSPGRYTLYTQFNLDGEVRTFPFTADVY
jgi:hypothetical protein